ncbi:hypothetical protein M409DRAFT_58503 [Zasmidium cellare ATCC 36951]|uniref:Zn(2)-C6 fungal-type domain-containing protein n=1 Tax=Zasmidium cellare ATCC 36951 TaxID=1080233 RepID=A0A6A6C4V1_ZASCE|nr:uncharacterized protein M409DRAFT_58503 [Zasmidium cellare ATCC 36951]KAF2162045.1 hypothetical protein M409DRAFT_58503 [Zasmidium cellare ATCC 36951]
MSTASQANRQGTKRACDQCRRRKTRCIPSCGTACRKCSINRLQCTFSTPVAKRGPKAHRGKIISELRNLQSSEQSPTSSRQSPATSQTSSSADEDVDVDVSSQDDDEDDSQLLPATGLHYPIVALHPTPAHLTNEEVATVTEKQERDTEDGFLSFALGVYTMIARSRYNQDSKDDSAPDVGLGKTLLHELSRLRSSVTTVDRPTIASIVVSLLMFHCFSALDNGRSAWFYLRQATTFALALGLHEQQQQDDFLSSDTTRGHVLYCILFITERNDSLQRQNPLTLPMPSTRHTLALEYACRALGAYTSLARLIRLYTPFDEVFLQSRTGRETAASGAERLTQLQDEVQAMSLVRRSAQADACTVDFICSKYWLQILIWQIALSQGQLSTTARDVSLTFIFPVRIANELLGHLDTFPLEALQIHGPVLTEKLFDVACALLDVLMCVPLQHISPEGAPRSNLGRLMSIIATLPRGSERFNPLLHAKVSESPSFYVAWDDG